MPDVPSLPNDVPASAVPGFSLSTHLPSIFLPVPLFLFKARKGEAVGASRWTEMDRTNLQPKVTTAGHIGGLALQ